MGNVGSQLAEPVVAAGNLLNPISAVKKILPTGSSSSPSTVVPTQQSVLMSNLPKPTGTSNDNGISLTDVPIVKDTVPSNPLTDQVNNNDALKALFSAQTADVTKMFSGFQTQLDDLQKQVAKTDGTNGSLLSGLSGSLTGGITDVLSGQVDISKNIANLNTGINSTILGQTGVLQSAIGAQTQIFQTGFDTLGKGIDRSFDTVDRSIGSVSNKIDSLQAQQLAAINGITGSFNNGISQLGSTVNNGISQLGSTVNNGISGVNQNLLAFQNNSTNMFMQSQMTALQLADRTATSVDNAFNKTLDSTQKALAGVSDGVGQLASDISGLQTMMMLGGVVGLGALLLMQQTGGASGTIIVR